MNLILGLLLSKVLIILVVVDFLSKHGHFMPLQVYFTSTMVAKDFINNVVNLHGVPHLIVSDNDQTFTSRFWHHLFQ